MTDKREARTVSDPVTPEVLERHRYYFGPLLENPGSAVSREAMAIVDLFAHADSLAAQLEEAERKLASQPYETERELVAQLEAAQASHEELAERVNSYRAQLEAARKREQWLIKKNEEIQRWAEAAQEVIEAADSLITHLLEEGSGGGTMRDSVLLPRYRKALARWDAR